MTVTYHSNNKSQSDYKEGAIQIQSTDPSECFILGEILNGLADKGYECVHGDWGEGKFIRLPLTKSEIWQGDKTDNSNDLTIPR